MKNSAVILISCPDRKGIVATISDFVFRHNGNILHADEHADEGSNLFLMRVEFDPAAFDIDLADFSCISPRSPRNSKCSGVLPGQITGRR